MSSRTYVALDLELIEANTPASRVIEIGAVRFDEDRVIDEWHTLVNPGSAVPYVIRLLTGLGDAELGAAPTLERVTPQLREFIGDDPLVGQSIEIDVAHLQRQGVRVANPQLDTFQLATLLLPGLPNYELTSIARYLGVSTTRPHRALEDSHLAREVFLALCTRVRALDLDILMHVNRLTSGFSWQFHELFVEAEQERRRRLVQDALSGASVGPLDMGLGRVLEPSDEPPEPLVPNARTRSLDVDGLTDALSPGGSVESILSAYERRPEQIEMLRAVADAFNHDHHLLVEAGTGTGKSMAYLLPSLAFAAANNQRVVVSTNTINLQDQLFDKDVPDLVRAMGYGIRASVLKGRTNYLCLRRWLALLRAESFLQEEATLLVKTLLWIGQTQTGDRSELRLTGEEEAAWSRICSQAESCSPLTCSYHRAGTCFVARARRGAEASHLVIVNHALLLSDLATSSRVMPDYDHLVIDEAHHLEQEATSQLGYAVSLGGFALPLDALGGSPGREAGGSAHAGLQILRTAGLSTRRMSQIEEAVEAARGLAEQATTSLSQLFQFGRELVSNRATGAESVPTVRLTSTMRRESTWLSVEDYWEHAHTTLDELLRQLGPLLEELGDAAGAGSDAGADALTDVLASVRQLELSRDQLHAIVSDQTNTVCWLTDEMGAIVFHLAPLDVAPQLRKWLLEPKSAVVLTSATLTTDNSFDYIRERLGTDGAEELMLGSPFDYEQAALVLLPEDLPEPSQPGYTRRAADVMGDVAEALGGRTLVLFTSYAQLKASYEMLRERMEQAQIVLMGQGIDGPRNRLLQRFKATDRALLLGTASFWEGVDVVGDALSALVIARLPFAVPTDPVFAARSDQFENPFAQYAVPQAILRFKQGFGRLIRSQTDRGAVVVLDRRILSKSYGSAFVDSLPTCTVQRVKAASIGTLVGEWMDVKAGTS